MAKDIKKTLKMRAKSKYVSRGLTWHLTNNERVKKSPLIKSYRNTWYCSHSIQKRVTEDEVVLVSTYCKNRWCPVCSRIRTGQAINHYQPVLAKFNDPQFVTLTARTVTARQLYPRLRQMAKVMATISSTANRRRKGFKGLRALECTARPGGLYHPHYHIILDGRDHAEWLVKSWLRHFKGCTSRRAQDIRPADSRSYKELFKYATKLSMLAKDEGAQIDSRINAEALDTIFTALKGSRVLQPFGGVKRIKEEAFEELEAQGDVTAEAPEGEMWEWRGRDWVETSTGELLTGYDPAPREVILWMDGETMKQPKRGPGWSWKQALK